MPFAPLVDPVEDLPADERVRTARHRVMFDFGDAAQRRLAAAHVAVVGAGGLGSAVILALAAAGVGTLTVVDDDDVDLSNLQRQVLHRRGDVGAPKVDSAVRAAADLSATRVIARRARLDTRNAADLLAGAHVIVDGSDTFDTRRAVAAASESTGLPLVWGTVQEFAGQATVFWSRPSAGTPIVLDDLYPAASVGTLPSCAEVGVFGPLCLQIGAVLATETVKLVTGVGEPLLGRVLLVDALRGTQREVPLRPARVSA
jgi:adenylyltransferase/sulfurtransferase